MFDWFVYFLDQLITPVRHSAPECLQGVLQFPPRGVVPFCAEEDVHASPVWVRRDPCNHLINVGGEVSRECLRPVDDNLSFLFCKPFLGIGQRHGSQCTLVHLRMQEVICSFLFTTSRHRSGVLSFVSFSL